MFIRTAGDRDLEAIRSLLVDTWHATYDSLYGVDRVTAITDEWHSRGALRARLDRPGSEFIVADTGEKIVGMAFATLQDEGKTILLHQIYVRPDMQGRGIGGLLLDEIEDAFPGAERLRLEVDPANSRAVAFYLGQAFEKVGATADCGGTTGLPADIYERPVPGSGEPEI
jgi:ribosomal protein S18 acetylase RimI-like enzyme